MIQELNNEWHIKQAMNTHVMTIEPLYWSLEDALFDKKIELAKSLYEGFLYLAQFRKSDLVKHLKPVFLDRLQVITYELYGSGDKIVHCKPINLQYAVSSRKIPFDKESELQQYLVDHTKLLSDALCDSVEIKGTEFELVDEYRCDLICDSSNTRYVVELKIGQATHHVVSQINKYCYYVFRTLRYDKFKNVQGVVICNGLDSWSINAIRQDGHLCFIISDDNGNVLLNKI